MSTKGRWIVLARRRLHDLALCCLSIKGEFGRFLFAEFDHRIEQIHQGELAEFLDLMVVVIT
jgi:hypothetical protein